MKRRRMIRRAKARMMQSYKAMKMSVNTTVRLAALAAFSTIAAGSLAQEPKTQPAEKATSQPSAQNRPGKSRPVPSEAEINAARQAAMRHAAEQSAPKAPAPGNIVKSKPTSTRPAQATPRPAGGKPPVSPPPSNVPVAKPAAPVSPINNAAAAPATTQAAGSDAVLANVTTSAPVQMTTMMFMVGKPDPEARTYRFDYRATPWPDVLSDFARMSGLPFLNVPDPPISDALTFSSPKNFTYREALSQLNELLLSRVLNKYLITRQDNFLTIERLPDLMRKIPPERMFSSFEELEAAKLDRFDLALVNFTVPEGWSAYEIIEEFRPLFSDTYGTQVRGDKIELTGLVEEHFRFRDVVNKIAELVGGPPESDPRPQVTIDLKNVRAADAQTILRQLYPPSAAPAQTPGVDQKSAQARRLDLIPDIKNNKLILKGPQRLLDEVTKIVKQLDGGTGSSPPEMKVIKLQHADANMLTTTLKQIFMKEQQALARPDAVFMPPEEKASAEMDIFPDAPSNSVILVCGKKGLVRAEGLVRQWDVPSEAQVTEVIDLKHADPSVITGTLATLMPQVQKPGQLADKITPRNATSLLISASRQSFERIKSLIEKLDVPADDEAKEHIVQLKAAVPSMVVGILQQAVSGLGKAAVARPAGQPQQAMPGARFIPDDLTGFLIAYCSDKEWQRAEALIRTIDEQAVEVGPRLVMFNLKLATANDICNMLRQMFPPTPGKGAPTGAQAAFFADVHNNVVQVYGSAELIGKVTPLIEQLDVPTTAAMTVMHLKFAKADVIAPILSQSFGSGGPGPAAQAAVRAGGGNVPASTGGVRIVAEPVTNSLLVNASPRDMEQIRSLVDGMEAEAQKQADVRIIVNVANRSATELAETIKGLSSGGAAPAKGAPGGGASAAASATAKPLTIIPAGRQIIFDGPQDQVAKAVQLFQQLDVPYEQPFFRKYAVQDAEEDERKLRSLLAMSPTASTEPQAAGGKGAAPKTPAQPLSLSAPDAVQIYPDTYENTLLVGVKVEGDFQIIENLLKLMFAEGREVDPDKPLEATEDFFVVPLKYKKAFDVSFTVEDIINPEGKATGVKLDEGPTERTLLVRNCKPGQKDKLLKLIEMFDVPEHIRRKNVRILDPEKMAPEHLARILARNMGAEGKTVTLVESDLSSRVQTIDIHADEMDDATGGTSNPQIQPCAVPSSLIRGIISAALMGQVNANQPKELPDPAVCPICHQSPCALPGKLLSSLSQISVASFNEDLEPDDVRTASEEQKPQHNHPTPQVEAAPQPATSQPLKIMTDPDTGKIILFGSEEDLDFAEEIFSDLVDTDSPAKYVVFPIKYSDVMAAAQLLEQVFNQGQAGAAGRGGRAMPQPMPMIPQPQPQGQPGQPGQPGQQGKPPQQPQQMAMPAAPQRIKVIPDVRTRSLFVIAPGSDIPLIVDVLKKIDAKSPTAATNIKIFWLVNLDATQVVENLREVLGLTGQARGMRGPQAAQQIAQQVTQQMLQMQGQPGQPGQPGQGPAATISSTDNVQLTADEQTNAIIAKAPPDTLELIDSIIKQLEDQPNTAKPDMRRVPLAHARATDIATIVKDIAAQVVSGAAPAGGAPGGGGGGRRGGAGRVSVNADARTNSVILAGASKDLDRVETVIKELDVDSGGGAIRQFAVKGDANAVANALKSLFVSGPQSDIIITAEASTGIVLVKAAPPQMAEIEKQIEEMENKIAGSQGLKSVVLTLGDPESIATKLQEIFAAAKGAGGAKQQILVKGNKSNQTIYVSGADEETFASIKKTAEDMDRAPTGTQVKSFQLKYASAVDVDAKLKAVMAQAIQTKGLGDMKLDLVGVVPDARTNSLVVTGGPITFMLIGETLKAIDVEASDSMKRESVPYQLPARVDVAQIVRNVSELFMGPDAKASGVEVPTVTGNPDTNVMTVLASKSQHEQIVKAIIEPMMSSAAAGIPETRFVPLKYARAEEATKSMTEAFKSKTQPNTKGQWPVTITADVASNNLIITAPSGYFEDIDAMIAALDVKEKGAGARTERTLALSNTSASDMAAALQQIFTAANAGRPAGNAPTIKDVPGTAKIIALASEEEWEQIQSLVKQIDVEGGRGVHAVTMPELVPVKTVADTIKQLYGNKPDGIKAEYHEPTNTLLVHATESEFARVKEQVIDVVSKSPTVGILQIYRIPLKYAVADEVAKTLQDFFDKKGGVSRNQVNLPPWMRGGGETAAKQMDNQVSITAEPTSNMLLVYCTDTTKKLIDEIIADIDTNEPPGGPNLMEMVELKYVDAEEMISILTEYLKVARRSPDESNKQPIPWWMDSREDKKEEKAVLAGDMRLKAVESMNAIILVGKPERVADCKKKIAEMDIERPGGPGEPIQIAMKNGNANEIAEILNKVFNDPKRAEKSKSKSYLAPVIEAFDANNSLIVSASGKDFNLIKKMAESLDQQLEGETGGGVRVLPVTSNVDIEELAQNIEKRMNDGENNRKNTQKEYKPSLVSIGADVRANALLVAGSKGKYEEVKMLVDQLMALGPTGGTTRRVIQLKSLSPEQAKQLLEQIQSGPSKGGAARPQRGPRSDAGWIGRDRVHQPAAQRRVSPIFAMSMPLLTAQIFCASAIAQTPPESKQPVISTIRPAATQPAKTRQLTPAELIREKAQGPMDLSRMSDEAKEAFRRKLSGTPITIAEAGPDNIIIEGADEDVEVVMSILDMLDTATPAKEIEYVPLKNAQSKNLAETLKKVFEPLEKRGQRETRPEDKVDLIADPQTNGIYIAATKEKMEQVLELIRKNEMAASESARNVKSFVFKNRRVMEVGEVLKKMVSTYLGQKGLDKSLIGIEIDPQTNTIFVTAGETDLKFVEQIIGGLDAELPPAAEGRQPVGEADVMVVPLRIAQADTLGVLLSELLKKAATGDTPMKDFIRRFRLLDEKGNPIAVVNLDRPIVIFGEKDSNSLIIASTKENCLIMKQVALAFDKEPARAEVQQKTLQMKFADATEVAEQITKFLKDSENLTARPGKGDKSGVPDGTAGALVYAAVVTADPRTNQVMLVGRPEAVVVLEDLINRLDVKGLDVMPFEFVKLEYASASGLEEALSALMKERAEALPKGTSANAGKAETVIIKGDPRSRSLIIAGKAARIEELKGLIAKLDIPSTALIEDIRTITLKKASAGEMAEKLKKLWEDRQQQQEGSSKGLKLEVPAIVADERSNSLIVAAAKGDFDAIKGVVEKIEALELNPMANIYLLKLKYNSAKALAPAMTKLFEKRAEMRTVEGKSRPEDKVAIEVDEVGNSLLMVGSRENYEVLAQKVGELDVELGVPGQVEYFLCTNVGAARVKDTLDELFKDGIFKPGGGAGGETGKEREKVTVTVDDRANMLIVSASPENMELVREIYKRMNSVATPWDAAITKLIIITHGDAVKIAAQVKDHFEKIDKIRETSAGGESKSKGAFGITVFADDRSNRIVIGGTKDGIDSAVELVKQLDVMPGQPGQVMEVYRLTEAPAAKIGEMIKKVFEERNKPRDGDTGPKVTNIAVSVETEESTNSLLINASREDHILVKDLVDRLDRPSTLLDMVKVIPLEKAPAERVKEILEELYKSTGGKGGEGGDSGKGVGVVEDKRTNSVVITAPPGELKNIEILVKRLDETEVKGQAQVGVFICENEDAKQMAELLNQIMTGKGGPEGSTEGGSGGTESKEGAREISSMLISFAATDELGRETLLKTIRENVQITYSERTNSVIAVAPPSTLKIIEQLVHKLDTIQKRAVLVKAFVLRNADATKMVEILEQMFAQEEGQEDEQAFQQGREISVEGGTSATSGVPQSSSQTGATQKGTFGRPKTTFVADERTNSLIVAGWPEDVDVVADVIDQLDSQPVQDRDGIVISLVNAVAEDVQSALQEFFDAETQRLDALGESISPQRRMEQEVSVVAHPESNQLLLSVSPRYKAQVLSLIEQLDQPPPQVMIQVVIAEVTLDDRFEMGLEFALQELRFSETAVAGGNGVLQSSHFDAVGGTDLGAAGSGLGGFSFTLTGEDFNFLVRALQSDSRLEVIQRPMIMCQDNQQANITIGQSVPTPSGAQTFGGQTSTQVQYQEVGVLLSVEPHINPDGFVYMLVEPEISSVTDSTIQIAPGAFAPIFNKRNASTSVAVKDGETVVIGGLITTTETQAESKVPLLGDIPGVGVLFRTTTRTKNKTELLIALTPHVVRTVEDARRISIEERDRTGFFTDEMKQSPLFEKLQVKPEDASEIDSIEVPPDSAPYDAAPVEQIRDDSLPEAPDGEPKRPYGPQVPRYGPMTPGAPDPVATRTFEGSRTSLTGAAR
jgi:type II secretory pathway component GspD/PulD (secretin)